MKSFTQIREIVNDIDYKNWRFAIQHISGSGDSLYLQCQWYDADNPAQVPLKGRKWLLSRYMTETEIVSTAFMAIRAAEEHEIREKFQYKGSRVFGPHIAVDQLEIICEQLDVREPVGV